MALDFVGTRQARQLRMRDDPACRVARDVEFRHDADAASRRIGDDPAHLLLGEEVAIRALALELGVGQALDAEALVVGQMQVQDVQLHDRHGVEIALDDLDRLPVARDIDHEPPPGNRGWSLMAAAGRYQPRRILLQELQEGFQPMHDAQGVRGPQFGLSSLISRS